MMRKIIKLLNFIPEEIKYISPTPTEQKKGVSREVERFQKRLEQKQKIQKEKKFVPFTGVSRNFQQTQTNHQPEQNEALPPFMRNEANNNTPSNHQNANQSSQKNYTGKKNWLKNTTGMTLIVDFGTTIDSAAGFQHRNMIQKNYIKIEGCICVDDLTKDKYESPQIQVHIRNGNLVHITQDEAMDIISRENIRKSQERSPRSPKTVGSIGDNSVRVDVLDRHEQGLNHGEYSREFPSFTVDERGRDIMSSGERDLMEVERAMSRRRGGRR